MSRFEPRVDFALPKDSEVYWFVLRGQELLVDQKGNVPLAGKLSIADSPAVTLGILDGVPCIALGFEAEQSAPDGFVFHPLRSLFGTLEELHFSIAGRAMHLLEWDRNHRFCGRCGQATQRVSHERNRKCTSCGASHFPRLSPAVIGAVEKEGRILLAKNAQFPRPFYSTIAGFVDPGESLEEAFAREVQEEIGIAVTDIHYFGSQSWPFTSSLMIGFTARYLDGEICVDGKEISDAQWFPPDRLPPIPPPISIARELIDSFVARCARK